MAKQIVKQDAAPVSILVNTTREGEVVAVDRKVSGYFFSELPSNNFQAILGGIYAYTQVYRKTIKALYEHELERLEEADAKREYLAQIESGSNKSIKEHADMYAAVKAALRPATSVLDDVRSSLVNTITRSMAQNSLFKADNSWFSRTPYDKEVKEEVAMRNTELAMEVQEIINEHLDETVTIESLVENDEIGEISFLEGEAKKKFSFIPVPQGGVLPSWHAVATWILGRLAQNNDKAADDLEKFVKTWTPEFAGYMEIYESKM